MKVFNKRTIVTSLFPRWFHMVINIYILVAVCKKIDLNYSYDKMLFCKLFCPLVLLCRVLSCLICSVLFCSVAMWCVITQILVVLLVSCALFFFLSLCDPCSCAAVVCPLSSVPCLVANGWWLWDDGCRVPSPLYCFA